MLYDYGSRFKIRKTNGIFLFHFLLLAKFVCLQVTNCQSCATFYSEPSFRGVSFSWNNNEQSTNLAAGQRESESDATGWQVTGSIIVKDGCNVRVCNENDFDGTCHILSQGAHSVTDVGKSYLSNIASGKCTCGGINLLLDNPNVALGDGFEFKSKTSAIPKPIVGLMRGKRENEQEAKERMQIEYQRRRAAEAQEREEERREHEKRMERMMNEMWNAQRRRENQGMRIEKNPEKGNGGCLKRGTRILMQDMSERTVENLKVGHVILDRNFRSTVVLGVTREFLLDQKFYGFEPNNSFFTGNHLFVGSNEKGDEAVDKLYAKSTHQLYQNNPLMAYANVTEFDDHETVDIYQISRGSTNQVSVSRASIKGVYQDRQSYPENTIMYDIMVDSPSGTYFANGYLCKHELPPVEKWPNTMSLLFRLMGTSTFEKTLPLLPFTVKMVKKLHEAADEIGVMVQDFMSERSENIFKLEEQSGGEGITLMTLGDVNVEECISRIFENPVIFALGLRLYSRVGPVIAPYLDNGSGKVNLPEKQIAILQNMLYNFMDLELGKRLANIL